MSLFGIKKATTTTQQAPTASIVDELAFKGAALREHEAVQYRSAQDLQVAAQQAVKDAAEAARKAKAVEEAVQILDDAGVVL